MDAGSFVTGARNVLDIGTRVEVRLGVGACFSAEFEHSRAQTTQERTIV